MNAVRSNAATSYVRTVIVELEIVQENGVVGVIEL